MSNYRAILGVMDDDPLVVTPSYTLDRMNRLNTAMGTFQQDVWRALPGPTQPFSLAFGAFKIEWDKFYKDNGPGSSGWASRLWGSTMDSVINYENRLNEWKDKFRALVGTSPSAPGGAKDPVTDPTQPQKKPPPDKQWSTWQILGAAALGVAGVAAVGHYVILPLLSSARGVSSGSSGFLSRGSNQFLQRK